MNHLSVFTCFVFSFVIYLYNADGSREPVEKFSLSSFSSKTSYKYHGFNRFSKQCTTLFKDCELVSVNAIFRHGSRSPSRKDMEKSSMLHQKLMAKPHLHSRLPSSLLNYTLPFEKAEEKKLLASGVREMYELGKRFKSLLSAGEENKFVKFFSSSVDRSKKSGSAFFNGFFNLSEDSNVSDISIRDEELRFFEYCERYIKTVEENASSLVEYKSFLNSPEVIEIRDKVRSEIGDHELSVEDIVTIYQSCGYEIAAQAALADSTSSLNSPWCQLLPHSSLYTLEYLSDIKHFWRKSNGYSVNYLQSCILIGEVFNQLKNVALKHLEMVVLNAHSRPWSTRGFFWFGHAETLIPVVTALGLFNGSVMQSQSDGYWDSKKEDSEPDIYMTARGLRQRMEAISKLSTRDRTGMECHRCDAMPGGVFRAGLVSPFSGNLAFHLYFCPIGRSVDAHAGLPPINELSNYRVQLYLNEKPIHWPCDRLESIFDSNPDELPPRLDHLLEAYAFCLPGVYNHSETCRYPEEAVHEDL